MLVTFKTKAYANITMFGDVAVKLLRMMGHSGTVPSAILAEDVPAALDRLKAAIAEERKASGEAAERPEEGDEEPKISIAKRAVPLLELLEAAAKGQCDVMWES